MRLKSMRPDDIPKVLILHGEWGRSDTFERWRSVLGDEAFEPEWNAISGNYAGAKVWVAGVFGSAMAAFVAHPLCQMGTPLIVQTGYFGGLSPAVDYGEALLISHADCHDGVATSYLPRPLGGYESDPELSEQMRRICVRRDLPFSQGKIISTDAVLTEDRAKIQQWRTRGFVGVDMETATTFAVAHKFERKAVAILNLSDHLVRGDSFFEYTPERRQIETTIDSAIFEVVLALIEERFPG